MDQPKYPSSLLDRFLRYVTYDTQADNDSTSYPSTDKQLVLLRRLAEELREIGAEDVTMDDWGYVMATVPATVEAERAAQIPTIAFIAHVDTSPEMSGKDVRPLVHEDYDGSRIELPDDPDAVLDPADDDKLAAAVGHDLVTASGKTLLGADDKAGVAEIVAAAEVMLQHPEIPHGEIRLAFTPDEEVGRGTQHFDVEKLGARYAYTLDGGPAGELESETFSADAFTVTFRGFNTHPGYAKDKLVNALKVAATFLSKLPKDLAPESTEDRQGFVHPYRIEGGVDAVEIRMILRDHDTEKLRDQENLLRRLASEALALWSGARVDIQVEEQYRNMREVIEQHPQVVEAAEEAIRRAGLEVHSRPIRGGTDGSKLSFMGLPTPNLFAGQHNIHSRLEWADVWEMHKAVEVIVEIAQIWAEGGDTR